MTKQVMVPRETAKYAERRFELAVTQYREDGRTSYAKEANDHLQVIRAALESQLTAIREKK